MIENKENVISLAQETPHIRTMDHIQNEYNNTAAQLGDVTCRIALLQQDITTLEDAAHSFKCKMFELQEEARAMRKSGAFDVQ